MRKNNKQSKVVKAIRRWYTLQGRTLPWRNIDDPYRILISEIMLQQTQVSRVLIKFPEFLKRFPTLQSLSDAKQRDVVLAWQGMGYNNRAVRLHKLAQEVVKEHRGKIPADVDSLLALPGIGKYTANALLSSAFGKHLPIVDVNVRRVLSRIFWRMKSTTAMRSEKEIWKLAERIVGLPVIARRILPTYGLVEKQSHLLVDQRLLPACQSTTRLVEQARRSAANEPLPQRHAERSRSMFCACHASTTSRPKSGRDFAQHDAGSLFQISTPAFRRGHESRNDKSTGNAYDWNQALMDLGALVCTANNPKCLECPVLEFCASRKRMRHERRRRSKNEPSLAGIPNRIYRGRIIEHLRKKISLRLDVLGNAIHPKFSRRHESWLKKLIAGLATDGLVTVKYNGSLQTSRIILT